MLFFIRKGNKMKNKELLKWNFSNAKTIQIVNDQPCVVDLPSKTFYFSLLHGGINIFEQLFGCSILSALNGFNLVENKEIERIKREIKNEEAQKKAVNDYVGQNRRNETIKAFTDTKFIGSLIASSYLKIENGQIICNQYTADEIIESEYISYMLNDMNFIANLIEMVTACLNVEDESTKKKQQRKNPNQKKKIN